MRIHPIFSSGLIIFAFLAAAFAPSASPAQAFGGEGMGGAIFPGHAQAPTATTVSVNPATPSVSGCDILDVYIDVNDVANLYAIDVRLTFNPAVLEVVDFDTASPTVDLEPIIDPSPNLNFQAGYTVRNEANNFTGTIWYAATQTAPTPAANGSGHVARVRLRAKSTGSSALTFTYIKLSDPNGVQIAATGTNGSVSASTAVAPTLNISRLNATQVQLSWPVASLASVSRYHLFRSTVPYFNPAGAAYQTPANPGTGSLTFNDTVLGNVTTNYFYALRAECTTGGMSAASVQVGKFEYQLYETTGTDYSWIGLVLSGTGITTAQTLANHIQNNSNGSIAVRTVTRWNASGQGTSTYNHTSGFGNYAVAVKNPYRIEIDLPSVSSGSVIWAQVGNLPAITTDTYTLYETSGTDYTWLLLPLDMTLIANTIAFAGNIQTYASAPVAVLTISRWNPSGQSYGTYNHQSGFGNFTTRFGYPYRVEVNVNTGFTVTWP
jgi:hypothetical protein